MNATQRNDGTFVDVRTDTRTVTFQRPSLAQFQAFQARIFAGQAARACLDLGIDCACNADAARELFDEWPGATGTVAAALAEMVTPVVKTRKIG